MPGQPSFAGQRLDLPPDAEPVADQAADLVEDFGQVATGLALQEQGGDEEFQVEVGDPVAESREAFFHGDAQVLLLEDAIEFLADRRAHFRGHHVEAEGQALPARSARESISKASGNWAAKSFRRLRRRNSTQPSGSDPSATPANGTNGTGTSRTIRQPGADRGQAHRKDRHLAGRQRRVGLVEQPLQVEMAETLRPGCPTTPGPGPAGCASTLACFNSPSLAAAGVLTPVSKSRRSSRRLPGFWSTATPPRRPGRSLPRTRRGRAAADSPNPPSSPVGGRRWTAAARPPSPAAA